jgi:3-oxoacyl-[acyl-carrier-protein] synthase II
MYLKASIADILILGLLSSTYFSNRGMAEMVATVVSIRDSMVHPTINYETPDPECDLDYVPNQARKMEVKVALSNSFGFGGHNATLVVGKLQ